MKNLILITSFLLLFSSCGQDTTVVQTAFAKLLVQEEWTEEIAKEYLSTNSINYLNKLAEISDSLNYQAAEHLGFEYSRELVTMKMHGEMVSYKTVFKPKGESLTVSDILFMMQFNGTGIIGMNTQNRVAFKQVADMSEQNAKVEVLVATGDKNAKIISNYIFNQEGEDWKLDLLSTLSLEEKVLKQNLRRSPFRNDKAAFIANHLSSAPKEMQFQYRMK